MSKSVLLMFLGMPRSFEITASNIIESLIVPNNNYKFTIVFNIENDVRFGKFKNLKYLNNTKGYNQDYIHIINSLKKNYPVQIKDITFYNIPNNKIGVGHDNNVRRILSILSKEDRIYDFYVNLRMDITLSDKIYLDDYNNSFLIVNSSKYRYCSFHNNDWDYMWIGYRESFIHWLSAYVCLYPLFDNLDSEQLVYSSLHGSYMWQESDKNLNLDSFKKWKKNNSSIDCKSIADQVGIIDLFYCKNNSWIERPYFLLKYLLDLDFFVKLSEYDGIWATRYFNNTERNPFYLEQYYQHRNIIIDNIEKNISYTELLNIVYGIGRDKFFLDNILDNDFIKLSIKLKL